MKTTPAVRLLMYCLVLVPGLAGALPAGADTPSVQVRTATVVSQDVTETLTAFGVWIRTPIRY